MAKIIYMLAAGGAYDFSHVPFQHRDCRKCVHYAENTDTYLPPCCCECICAVAPPQGCKDNYSEQTNQDIKKHDCKSNDFGDTDKGQSKAISNCKSINEFEHVEEPIVKWSKK